VNDRELAQRLGSILNNAGRLDGRLQAMRDWFMFNDDTAFSRDFLDGIRDDIRDVERDAMACMEAISGPLKLAIEDGEPEDDGPVDFAPESWEDEEPDEEDSEWDDVQDV
jgi:hypothetical protein